MLRRLLLLAIVAGLVGLFAGSAPTSAGPLPAPNRVVDTNFPQCIPGPPVYTSIGDAVQASSPFDVIYVCPSSSYQEPTIEVAKPVTTLGPAVNGVGGIATVRVSTLTGLSMFHITADSVTVRGLDVDGTLPQNFNHYVDPFDISGSYGEISDNTIAHSSYAAISVYKAPQVPIDVTIQRNQVTLSNAGIFCICTFSYVLNNTVGQLTSNEGIRVIGSDNTISNNNSTGNNFYIYGDRSVGDSNTIYGNATVAVSMNVAGSPVTISNNTISDMSSIALSIAGNPFGLGLAATDAIVSHNRFQYDAAGIQIFHQLSDPAVTATIGGSLDDTNTFFMSGPGPLLKLKQVATDINAEYNDWGLCTLPEIENVIVHHPDDATLGTVDYDPFVPASTCATPTPTPSPTHSPTPTHTASPTPSPTATASKTPTPTSSTHLQGDLNCSGKVTGADGLLPMLKKAGLGLVVLPPCPSLGSGTPEFGDVTCDGEEDAADTVAILEFSAGLSIKPTPHAGCTPLGETLPA